MKKINSVTASRFLAWYFSDSDMVKDFGQRAVEMLESEGFVNISAKQLFEECGYIPSFICEHVDVDWDDSREYSPNMIEFIQD
jgi:hypothetical protein